MVNINQIRIKYRYNLSKIKSTEMFFLNIKKYPTKV